MQLVLSERDQILSVPRLFQAEVRERIRPRMQTVVQRVVEHGPDRSHIRLWLLQRPRPRRKPVKIRQPRTAKHEVLCFSLAGALGGLSVAPSDRLLRRRHVSGSGRWLSAQRLHGGFPRVGSRMSFGLVESESGETSDALGRSLDYRQLHAVPSPQMARPRIFISSTFYDLRQVRSDLELFLREIGHDGVINEQGTIPYGSDEKVEEYAYKEIDNCDILVAIIGGRFGSASQHAPYSISQQELKRATNQGKQVFIFIESAVYTEYRTYLRNKELEGIRYTFVDDIRVYQFIEEVETLPRGNPIASFETAQDITNYLREQFAGLFQRFLAEQTLLKEVRLIEDMQSTVQTLDRLVTFLSRDRDDAIQSILLISHPAFQQLQKLLRIPYRILFTNLSELNALLSARGWEEVEEDHRDDRDVMEWTHDVRGKDGFQLLKITSHLFDDSGKLKVFNPEEWDDSWMSIERRAVVADDDIPF